MRIIRYLLLGAVAAAMSAADASAARLTAAQALERGLAARGISHGSRSAAGYSLTYSDGGAVYVFSAADGAGFMAVAGDTAAPAVLGYSDSGTFDADDMPPAMRWWLGQYAEQIRNYAATATASSGATADFAYEPIEPMIATRWNQDAPYNALCPEIDGSRTPTGCVATAMAQVLRYHRWPERCQGGTYAYTTATGKINLSFDFDAYAPDWADMPARPAASNTAVADLMYACGVALNMDYQKDASAADVADAAPAMYKYFGYDAGIRFCQRMFYSRTEWNSLVYSQLKEYGPVLYRGQADNGGHAFVCDGCSADGYFHINWGWSGMSDGYFLLTALDPTNQGIGGSDGGFNNQQAIVGNVCRPKAGSTVYPTLCATQGFSIDVQSATLGSTFKMKTPVINFSAAPVSGTLGLRFTDEGGSSIDIPSMLTFSNLPVRSFYPEWDMAVPSILPAGTYTVTPVVQVGGKWYEVETPVAGIAAYKAVIAGSQVTFSPIERAGRIAISDISLGGNICIGSSFRIECKVANSGNAEFYGYVAPALMRNGKVFVMSAKAIVDVEPGETIDFSYSGIFNDAAIAEGDYDLCFVDPVTGEIVSDPVAVTVLPRGELWVTDFKYTGYNPSDLNFTADVRCTKGYFDGEIQIVFAYDTNNIIFFWADPQHITLGPGETTTITTHTSAPDLDPDTRYQAVYLAENKQVSDIFRFVPGNEAGIGLPSAAQAPKLAATVTDGPVDIVGGPVDGVRVYSISGACIATYGPTSTIDLSSSPAGIYLVEITSGPARTIARIMRR